MFIHRPSISLIVLSSVMTVVDAGDSDLLTVAESAAA